MSDREQCVMIWLRMAMLVRIGVDFVFGSLLIRKLPSSVCEFEIKRHIAFGSLVSLTATSRNTCNDECVLGKFAIRSKHFLEPTLLIHLISSNKPSPPIRLLFQTQMPKTLTMSSNHRSPRTKHHAHQHHHPNKLGHPRHNPQPHFAILRRIQRRPPRNLPRPGPIHLQQTKPPHHRSHLN